MVATVATVAYLGLEARAVEVQVQLASGLPHSSSSACPTRRSPKAASGSAPRSPRSAWRCRPSGSPSTCRRPTCPRKARISTCRSRSACWRRSARPMPRACRTMSRSASSASTGGSPPRRACCSPRCMPRGQGKGLICPAVQGAEAAWAGNVEVLAAPDLLALLAHLKGTSPAARRRARRGRAARRRARPQAGQGPGRRQARAGDRRGRRPQSADERAAGRGQVAARRLPAGHPAAARAVRGAGSVDGRQRRRRAGRRADGRRRPFRAPHHSASMPALVGGGLKVRPGEISLAHLGVLFLDELPEFQRAVLDSLRQPLETGKVSVARANMHVTFPARVQMVAAMNPCRCGHLGDPALACSRAPRCAADYQAKVSGPLLDRIDLHVEVQGVSAADLTLPPPAEGSERSPSGWRGARRCRRTRYNGNGVRTNAEADGELLDCGGDARRAGPEAAGRCGGGDAAVGARLPPRAARRADHRRPRRRRAGRPNPCRRGAELPPPGAAELSPTSPRPH